MARPGTVMLKQHCLQYLYPAQQQHALPSTVVQKGADSRVQAVFTLGFALASLYHICHMHEAGLSESSLLGVSGLVWRTFDILCAQWLLGRTFSHAIGASHWVTRGMHIQSTTCDQTTDIFLFGKHFVLCASA